MKDSIYTVPNLLSVVRLLLIAPIVVTYSRGWFLAAAVLLALSGVTDMMDGYIARRFNQISTLGKVLDPIADKLTMAAVALGIALRHPALWLAMGVLAVKELTMLIGALILYKKGTRPAASKWVGKAATVLLYVVFFGVVITDLCAVVLPAWAYWAMAAACSAAMIAALISYVPVFLGILSGAYNVETERFEGETK